MAEKLAALESQGSTEFWANSSPKCPHCGSDFDVRENEAWRLFDEADTHEVDCPICSLEFKVNSSASWSFSTDEQED